MSITAAPPSTIQIDNPATGQVVGQVPSLTADDVARIAARGRAAQPAWAGLGFHGRARILKRAQHWMIHNADRVLETLLSETGKTQEDGRIAEIPYTAAAFAFWAKHAPDYLGDERVRSRSPYMLGRSLRVRYSPLGLVGVIGPWNYPLMNSFGDCIPALAAGNAVIHKPSTMTPLTAILMGEALRECGLPEDVYQVVTGSGGIGSYVVDQCDCIMFTGSTDTGKKIMARAAETLTPVHLELGGKDPMIVLADADLDVAAAGAVQSAFLNSGQACISTERVYVEEPVYDAFVSKVVERTRELRQGVPGAIGSTDIGAMATADQADLVDEHVRDAVAKGARVLTGGHKPEGPGHFYPPTVLVDVDHSMECMVEETFGPTLPIMRVADADEAVRLANDSPYGLQASVWSRDRARARSVADRLEAGVVTINDAQTNYMAFELPMGGWKLSGIGSRHGKEGIRKFAKRQSVMENRFPLKRPPYAMPYSARRTKALDRMTRLLYGRGRGR